LRYTTEQVRRAGANAIRRAGYRPRKLRTRQLFVLQGLPGVGPERAARLLDACGSVAGVFAADEAVLRRVPGIGARTAAAIYQLAHASSANVTVAAGPCKDRQHREIFTAKVAKVREGKTLVIECEDH